MPVELIFLKMPHVSRVVGRATERDNAHERGAGLQHSVSLSENRSVVGNMLKGMGRKTRVEVVIRKRQVFDQGFVILDSGSQLPAFAGKVLKGIAQGFGGYIHSIYRDVGPFASKPYVNLPRSASKIQDSATDIRRFAYGLCRRVVLPKADAQCAGIGKLSLAIHSGVELL